jgi:hypothetical protein
VTKQVATNLPLHLALQPLPITLVIPAKAGIQSQRRSWIPAFAGMTGICFDGCRLSAYRHPGLDPGTGFLCIVGYKEGAAQVRGTSARSRIIAGKPVLQPPAMPGQRGGRGSAIAQARLFSAQSVNFAKGGNTM